MQSPPVAHVDPRAPGADRAIGAGVHVAGAAGRRLRPPDPPGPHHPHYRRRPHRRHRYRRRRCRPALAATARDAGVSAITVAGDARVAPPHAANHRHPGRPMPPGAEPSRAMNACSPLQPAATSKAIDAHATTPVDNDERMARAPRWLRCERDRNIIHEEIGTLVAPHDPAPSADRMPALINCTPPARRGRGR